MKAGVEANTISYNSVIKACAEACEVATAEHWISMILKAGVEANTIIYNIVIKACAGARDSAGAKHWILWC